MAGIKCVISFKRNVESLIWQSLERFMKESFGPSTFYNMKKWLKEKKML